MELLLIEDNEDDAFFIINCLESAGMSVRASVMCSEEQVRSALFEKEWDVIICDHMVPGFSSTRALQLLQELNVEIPVLVVSGNMGEELAVTAIKAGAFDYVMKDKLARLPSAVANALKSYELSKKERLATEKLDESYDMLRKLAGYLQNIQEQERERLSRDIHDDLGSGMAALKIDIAWMKNKLCDSDEIIQEKLSGMSMLIDNAIGSVRRVISDLRPTMIDDLGLEAAIEWQLEEFGKRNEVRVELDCDCGGIRMLGKEREISVYRIVQESLNNIAKHSNANYVLVRVKNSGAFVRFEVIDDGCGFDVGSAQRAGSFGIMGMRERALVMGGRLQIRSRHNQGSMVVLSVPAPVEQHAGGELHESLDY